MLSVSSQLRKRRRMDRQRRYFYFHVREQWQTREQLVEFVIGFRIENTDVRVFADHAPKMDPLAAALQLLRIGFFLGLDGLRLGGRKVVRNSDDHVNVK